MTVYILFGEWTQEGSYFLSTHLTNDGALLAQKKDEDKNKYGYDSYSIIESEIQEL